MVFRGFTGSYVVFTGSYVVLLGFTGFDWVLLGSSESDRVRERSRWSDDGRPELFDIGAGLKKGTTTTESRFD